MHYSVHKGADMLQILGVEILHSMIRDRTVHPGKEHPPEREEQATQERDGRADVNHERH